MNWTPGRFVWRELLTHTPAESERFYGELFGWSFQDMSTGPDDGTYRVVLVGEKPIGGVFDLGHIEGGENVKPQWVGYVSVLDVDERAEAAVAAGAKLRMPPTDLEGVGRIAYLEDPQGGAFYLMKAEAGDPPDSEPGVGEFAFELLNAVDPAALATFYADLIGWQTQPMGPSTLLMRDGGKRFVASVAPAMPGSPAHWITHIVVADLEATNATAAALGAMVLEPCIEVPGYGRFALILDPQKVLFMTFEAPKG